MICKLCVNEAVVTESGIGAKCLKKLGIAPMGPAHRTAPCARCNAMRFIRAIPREHTAEPGYDQNYQQAAPMAVTIRPVITDRHYDTPHVALPEITEGVGRLEMYICASCGFIDWYCANPKDIPIGPEYMTEIVDLAGPTPYR